MSKAVLNKLIAGTDLTRDEARETMQRMMTGGLSEVEMAALLTALRVKGESVDEIAGFAGVMREHAVSISPAREGIVDTCGTGGDGQGTFNISTATALVAAAMEIPVAKHGNRAVSSMSGSADVLEALGVRIDLPPQAISRLIEEVGVGFLFAPQHHPAMKHAAPVRKQLGIRTIFNVLGPLTNPAGVKRQLLGVFSPDLTETLARVLGELGSEKAFVVHGMDGGDEVSITAETAISVLQDGSVETIRFHPREVGLALVSPDQVAGGSAAENASHIERVLAGEDGPRTDAVLLNAGFVALLADRVTSPADGLALAREAVAAGKASALLKRLREASQDLAEK